MIYFLIIEKCDFSLSGINKIKNENRFNKNK